MREGEGTREVACFAGVGAEEVGLAEDEGGADGDGDDGLVSLGQEHRVAATIPALGGDLFGHVGDGAVRVEVGAVEGGDGGFVGDAAGTDGSVGEEPGVEILSADCECRLGWEEIKVGVRAAGVAVVVGEMLDDSWDIVLAASVGSGVVLKVLEDARIEVVIVAVAEVKVTACA